VVADSKEIESQTRIHANLLWVICCAYTPLSVHATPRHALAVVSLSMLLSMSSSRKITHIKRAKAIIDQ